MAILRQIFAITNSPLRNYFYILTVESVYTRNQQRYVTSGDVRKRTVIRRIFGIRENCGSFVDAASLEP